MFDTLTASQSESGLRAESGAQEDHLSQFGMSGDALADGGPFGYASRQKRKAKRGMRRHTRKTKRDSYHTVSGQDELSPGVAEGDGDETAEVEAERTEVETEEAVGGGGTDPSGSTEGDTGSPNGSSDGSNSSDSNDESEEAGTGPAPAKVEVVDEDPGDCKCKETNLTGEKSDVPKPTTRERVPEDLALESKWDHWINYPQATWDAEKEQVAEYNQAYDQINSQERKYVDNLYDWRESQLDQMADGGEAPAVVLGDTHTLHSSPVKGDTAKRTGPARTDPQWQRDRDKADRELPMLWGEQRESPFSGFEGDLSYKRTSSIPVAANWLSASFTIGEAFGDAYANEAAKKSADYQVPIKNYTVFADKNGKETSQANYGFVDGEQPSRRFLSKQYYKKLSWCPVKSGKMGTREFNRKSNGGKFFKKKTHNVQKSTVKIMYYQQCATWEYKSLSGTFTSLPNGPERPLRAKLQEAEAFKVFHEKRLEYLEQMASIPRGSE